MKRLLLIISAATFVNTISFGQKWIPETVCSSDTITVEPSLPIKFGPERLDSTRYEPYKVVECRTRSKLGFRLDIAVSSYYYGEKTARWLGQHGGPNINYILTIDRLNIGVRFKPWTISPKREMVFDEQTLSSAAKLNNIRVDYYLGYSIDFEKLISLEPYVGYNRTSFHVINEDELNQVFSLSKTGGLILGMTLNKYFRLSDYTYISGFGTVGYGFVDYMKVHRDLDNGYAEWNLGIALKGFPTKRFSRKVD